MNQEAQQDSSLVDLPRLERLSLVNCALDGLSPSAFQPQPEAEFVVEVSAHTYRNGDSVVQLGGNRMRCDCELKSFAPAATLRGECR